MLAPVVLAALFAPACHGRLAPPTPVEQAMAYRRIFGLPSGRAHVRRVQRSDARRDDQGFAFTRREWRYRRQHSAADDALGAEGGEAFERVELTEHDDRVEVG